MSLRRGVGHNRQHDDPDHQSPTPRPSGPETRDRVYRSPAGLVGGALLLAIVLWLGIDALVRGEGARRGWRWPSCWCWCRWSPPTRCGPPSSPVTTGCASATRCASSCSPGGRSPPCGPATPTRSSPSPAPSTSSGRSPSPCAPASGRPGWRPGGPRRPPGAGGAGAGPERAPWSAGSGAVRRRGRRGGGGGRRAGPRRERQDHPRVARDARDAGKAASAQGEVTVRWAYEVVGPAVAGAVLLAVLLAVG